MPQQEVLVPQQEVLVKATARKPTADDVKAQIEAQLQAALETALTSARPEVAEPLYWWNVFGFGPIQPGAGITSISGFNPPLLPNQVIRAGEQAYVASIIVLNPFIIPGGAPPTPCEILQTFALPYEINFQMANLTSWTAAGILTSAGSFVPGGPCFYVNLITLPAQPPGLYEMNITARIFGAGGNPAPPFSGFAKSVRDLDEDLFMATGPQWRIDHPIRYQVYA
ncbi:MAG TPA: hypothetical protein IGS37_17995 [Synechococcales cyanobacterium M55_K2018_004]|nr:hypothetical protein [Synechococcales cyanobacterium M55_K2018_004]